MSLLFPPRLHGFGRVAISTPTGNNNNYNLVLDPDQVGFFEPYKSMSDDQFRAFMRTLAVKDCSLFGLAQIQVLNANWCYDGDHSVQCCSMSVTGADAADGSAAHDPIVGAPITLSGDAWGDDVRPPIIVDNDPTSDFTSQLFVSRLQVGTPACGFTAASTVAGSLPRGFLRWLYLTRNPSVQPDACFSAVFQLPLPNANLTFTGTETSPVLASLAAKAAAGLGLVARFCLYYFERMYTDQQMAAFYNQGDFRKNYSRGAVLGSIGVWNAGEFASLPTGRLLQGTTPLTVPIAATGKTATLVLAPATAAVDETRHVVALDLITAFPEVTPAAAIPPDNNPDPCARKVSDVATLQKISLGTATLQVRSAAGAVTPLGTFDYSTASYLAGGGIVEVPFASSALPALQDGLLEVACTGAPAGPVLTERRYVAETDDQSVYLTVGRSTTISVRVLDRGGVPAQPVAVGVQSYRVVPQLDRPLSGFSGVPLKYLQLTPQHATPYLQITPEGDMCDASGIVTFTLAALAPGVGLLRFLPGPDNPPVPDPSPAAMGSWLPLHFCYVRVLPADSHLDEIPDEQVTWDLVYRNVLSYYYRLFPAMDAFMPLNNKAAVAARANLLKKMIDPSSWNSTLYMPPTRDLSDGRRRLLQRWCDRVMRGDPT